MIPAALLGAALGAPRYLDPEGVSGEQGGGDEGGGEEGGGEEVRSDMDGGLTRRPPDLQIGD